MNPVVRLKGVGKWYGSHRIIEGLDLAVEKGEVVGIVGPSGIGKTTLLRLLAGLERPCSGEIVRSPGRIGYVFQETRLLPWRTALSNIVLPLLAAGFSGEKARRTALKYMRLMGLSGFEDCFPSQLSGGMVRRVSLSRAFAVRPEILILDEPFTGLDPENKDSMKEILGKIIKERPVTVFCVTHYPGDLESLATRRLSFSSPSRIQ